eukprot:403334229
MICTFGGAKKKDQTQKTRVIDNTGASGIGAMSEELRDEHINKKLNEAFQMKQQNQNDEALKIYLEIINLDFLKESKIDKHVFMKFNAFKNIGEIQERIGQYFQAKNYYTQAIKIKEKDSFIWTRLGFMEYEHFKNFTLAKECFEVAAQCYSTIQRRSGQINPILMKLAELAFQDYDFKTSEKMVDSILHRVTTSNTQGGQMGQKIPETQNQAQNPDLFACLLKSYFLSLRGDDQLCKVMLERARNIKQDSNYADIEVVSRFISTMNQNMNQKDIVVRTKNIDQVNKTIENRYDYIKLQNHQTIITVKPSKEYHSFIDYFDDFLLQFTQNCENQQIQILQNSLLDCDTYIPKFAEIFDLLNNDPNFQEQIAESLRIYEDQLIQKEKKLNNLDTVNTSATSNVSQPANTTKRGQAQEKQLQETKRQLRRKVDTTEQQLKQYNLQPLRDFKDFIINEGGFSDLDLEVIFSFNEIYKSKCYLSQESETQNIANGLQMMGLGYDPDGSRLFNNQDCGQERIQAIVETYWKFFEVVQKIQSRGVQYVLRNILRYLIDNPQNSQVFLTFENSSYLYRMFLLSSNNELTNQNLDAIGSFNVILTLFEMSLFNNQVIKHVKSNALITQRDRFYEYFNSKENEYFVILDREQKRLQSENNLDSNLAQQNDVLKIRFYHAMMFYSFEIKNDMHSSIRYYQKIENDTLRRVGKIQIPWVSTSFKIDENKLVQYGSCKIKEAQVVKDYDEALLALKQSELEDAKKNNQKTQQNKVKPDFTNLACFYLDQLCQYLQKAYQSESSVNANFSTNEEKIKEMWNKLQYSLCRCESQTLIRISCHLFSIMTAFQSIQKPFYDNFILKKLEFEPLITEICERLKQVFAQLMDYVRTNNYEGIADLKNPLFGFIHNLIYSKDEKDAINQLVKLEVDFLRLLNNEFLYFHIVQNQFRFGDQLLNSYCTSLYIIEMFVSILRAKPDDDLTVQLRFITKLVKQLDKLCHKNGEIFIRAYFKFLTQVLPFTLSIFMNQYDQTFNPQTLKIKGAINTLRQIQQLNENNDLLQMIIALCQYFYDIKFNTKDIQKAHQSLDIPNVSKDLNMSSKKFKAGRKDEEIKHNSGKLGDTDMTVPGNSNKKQQQQDQNYDDDEDEEESEEEKKNYRLKMVYKLKTQQVKMWNLITATNWIPKSTQPLQGITNQQLTYLYQQGHIEVNLLKDLFSFCNLMSSDRISQCGVLVKKDVFCMVTFLDVVGRFLQDNMKQYYDKCQKAQQMLAAFKEAMTINPFRFQIKNDAKCSCINGKQCILENQKLKETLSKLLRLFMNVISHMCIENSPYQMVNQSGKRKLNLSEVLYSLNQGGQIKLMKNLKRFSQLDMIYSSFSVESQLVFSQIQTEFYQLQNSTKLIHDYKENDLYKLYKGFYTLSQNTQIIALSTLRQQLLQEQKNQQSLNVQPTWSNVNNLRKMKLCLTQMITIIILKMQGKQLVKKRIFIGDRESEGYIKKEQQIVNLKQQIFILSMICEKLERLQVVSEDPRLGQNSNVQSTVRELLEKLFSIVQQSNQGLDDKMHFQLNPEFFESFVSQINQITGSQKIGMDQVKWKISFDYPLLQTMLNNSFKKHAYITQNNLQNLRYQKDKLKSEMSPIVQFAYLREVSQCLQIAFNSQSLNGCIECYIILIKGGLQLGLRLKYEESLFSNQELQELKSIYETVTKTLLGGNRQIFKFIHNKLVPLSSAYSSSRFNGNQGMDVNMSGAEDEERERSIILDDRLASSIQRPLIFATNDMPQFNEFESALHQLYLFGDRLYNIMGLLHARQWQKMRLQYALIMALKYEIKVNPINRETPDQEIKCKLKEMIQPVVTSINYIEDNYISQGLPNYYIDDQSKNLITFSNHTEFSLSELRIKLREFYLEITQEIQQYEPIKEMFKRQFQLQRQLENLQRGSSGSGSNLQQLNSTLAMVKSIEIGHLFNITKNQLIEALYGRVDRQLTLYLMLRQQILINHKNQQLQDSLMQQYKNFKDALQTTKESVPPLLKDIFELFVDSHLKKGMLNQRKLIDESQKRTIRQTLLKCSAFCGPDSEITNESITSKFLDLNRISDEEYECDGLLICLKWYMNILEERTNLGKEINNQEKTRAPSGSKIDLDLYKKLKTTYEEMDKAIKEQQQRNLLLQEQQMQLTNMAFAQTLNIGVQGQGIAGGTNFIPAHTSIATKVFDNQQ